MIDLRVISGPPYPTSDGMGISADGPVITGDGRFVVGFSTAPQTSRQRAFRWTPTTLMEDLGVLPGDTMSSAWAVSLDGSTTVGRSLSTTSSRAFRHSTSVPVLNVNDFQCFLNSFVAGCS